MNQYLKFITLLVVMTSSNVTGQERLRLATTTSTDNSGLLTELHPPFEEKYDVKIDVIAVGTGKALLLGQNGDVDILMVHAPASEIKFIEVGHGIQRLPVMHNDFVLIGPPADPAGLKSAQSLTEVMNQLAISQHGFVSRGDDSGTHKKEMSLWDNANITPAGSWYLSVGQGMGAVLRIANDKLAYTLTDRGTYLAFKDKINLGIVYEGDESLFNPYHVILLNDKNHPHIKVKLANLYADYVRSTTGQQIIKAFRINKEQLFYPDVMSE